MDDGGCDGDADTQGSRQQAAHTAQLNLRKKPHKFFCATITDSGMPCKLDIRVQNTVKKDYRISLPQPGCHKPNSPWPGII